MVLKIMLPFGTKENVKDIVFTILTKEYPLRIIDLMNFIRKRYGKSVTFQAVRKAVLQLKEENVLIQKDNKFSINKEWVLESKKLLDNLYGDLIKEKAISKSIDSIKGDISVFTFESLNDMMKFWQEIIDKWFDNLEKGSYNVNVYQAAHVWEGLLHLEREKELMSQLKKKRIKSFIVSTGKTILDKNIKKFYESIGVKFYISPSSSSFDRSYYIGTYGEMIIQTQYPIKLVKALDSFFKKNKTIKTLDLGELSNIVNMKLEIKLTLIKNLAMAKQINKSILSQTE
ncbi:MAG: hypothetical protein Q7S33_01570 [Nanoarchaeota archaeon]|nr:hypothetical protein [Nanoarchaeota archaeon]